MNGKVRRRFKRPLKIETEKDIGASRSRLVPLGEIETRSRITLRDRDETRSSQIRDSRDFTRDLGSRQVEIKSRSSRDRDLGSRSSRDQVETG